MTTIASPTQVRCTADGRLTARCVRCGLELVQLDGADVGAALSALDQAHPATKDTPHRPGTPAGWRAGGLAIIDLDARP